MNYPNLTAISCTPIFNGHYLQQDINTDPVYLTTPYLNGKHFYQNFENNLGNCSIYITACKKILALFFVSNFQLLLQ